MNNHDFCRQLLKVARTEARRARVPLPRGMTALKCIDGKQWFVESRDGLGQYVKADCAYDAKATVISEQCRIATSAKEAK